MQLWHFLSNDVGFAVFYSMTALICVSVNARLRHKGMFHHRNRLIDQLPNELVEDIEIIRILGQFCENYRRLGYLARNLMKIFNGMLTLVPQR